MAFTHYRTKGIFLKKEDRGEADQVFTLFTEDFGKVRVLAKAIRRITSKLRSGVDIFHFSEIEFIQGKQCKTLTDAVLIDKLALAYDIAEAVDCLTAEEQPDERIWNLLTRTLRAWQGSDPCQIGRGLTPAHFLWRLFDVLGYGPELYNCACCEKKLLPETFFFAPSEGGVVCWRCFKEKNLTAMPWCEVSVNTVKVLRVLLEEPFEMAERLKIQKQDEENLKDATKLYLNFLRQASNSQPKN